MERKGFVYYKNIFAGTIWQDEDGYHFLYDSAYLQNAGASAISFTLPLQQNVYTSLYMFSFFDGLIPEGWLLDISIKTWKINPKDRMMLLLTLCEDCIGAVSIKSTQKNDTIK